MTTDAIAEAIERYLRTGDYDPTGAPWPGNLIERSRRSHDELIHALVTEVMRRAKTRRSTPAEVVEILLEAAPRRNGWKAILARCAPPTRPPARAGRTEVAEA